jgi:O-antigen/teichoic acid export membrane protein
VLGVTVVLQQQFFADTTVLRTRGVFGRVAISQVAFALVHLAGLLWLVPSLYLTGALISWAAALAVAVLVMRLRPAEAMPVPRPSFSGGDLLVRGMPTYLVGVTYTVLLQTDQMIVGALLGAESLGLYGVMGLGASALLFLPDAFGGVLLPMAGERFGRAGERPEALSGLAERSVRGLALATAAALAVALAGTDFVVAWKLPNFAQALPAMRPYLAGVYLLALTVPLRFLLVTAGAGRAALAAQVGAWIAAVGLECAACLGGFGLAGVASACALTACALFGGLLVVAANRGVLTSKIAVRLFAETAGLLLAALVLDAALAGAAWWVRLAVPAILAGAAALHVVRSARRET